MLGDLGAAPKLGMTKLSALELLNKLNKCYGIRMLETFKEADLFATLLEYYEVFPYNDIALKIITNIVAYALDSKSAKAVDKAAEAIVNSKRRGIPGVGPSAWEEDKEDQKTT